MSLTQDGKQKFRDLWNVSESLRKRMVAAIEPDKLTEFIQMLKQLTTILHRERERTQTLSEEVST